MTNTNEGNVIEVAGSGIGMAIIDTIDGLAAERIKAEIKFPEAGLVTLAVAETLIFIRFGRNGLFPVRFQVGRKNNQTEKFEIDADHMDLTADQVAEVAVAEMKRQIAVDVLEFIRNNKA